MEMRQHSCYTAACRKTQKVISQLEHDTIDNLRSKQVSIYTERKNPHQQESSQIHVFQSMSQSEGQPEEHIENVLGCYYLIPLLCFSTLHNSLYHILL